jgi:sugar lactone lactonase YvrE
MVKEARMIVASFGFLAASGADLFADTFHPIQSIDSNTGVSDFYPAKNLIAGPGDGFEATPPHQSISPGAAAAIWVTAACGFPCDYYLTLPAPILTIDLGTNLPLHEISVWGYDSSNSNGAKKASLRFATSADGLGGFGNTIAFNPSFSILNDDTNRQSFAFGQTVTARYVEVTLTDNHFLPPGDGSAGELPGGDRVGLGEIAFSVPEADPEELLVTSPNDFTLKSGQSTDFLLGTLLDSENFWGVERSKSTGLIYLSLPTVGQIWEVDPNVDPVGVALFVGSPGAVFHGIALDEENEILLVADSATDTVRRFEMGSKQEIQPIGSGFIRPNDVLFDPNTGRTIVSDSGNDSIFIYSDSANLESVISNGSTEGAWGLAIDPVNGDLLYSSHDLGQIFRHQIGSNTSSIVYQNLNGPRGLEFDRKGRLYCVESTLNRVVRFTPTPVIFGDPLGARDISVVGKCDLDGDFLPDEWENTSGGLSLTFGGDNDLDGIPNAIEAATGTSGIEPNGSPLSVSKSEQGDFTLSHDLLLKSSLNLTLWLSDDLDQWRVAQNLPTRLDMGTGYERRTFQFRPEDEGFPVDTPELFFRLSATEAP